MKLRSLRTTARTDPALAAEMATVRAVMDPEADGHRPVFGAPIRCPDCRDWGLVTEERPGAVDHRCHTCAATWTITARALRAVRSEDRAAAVALTAAATEPVGALFADTVMPPFATPLFDAWPKATAPARVASTGAPRVPVSATSTAATSTAPSPSVAPTISILSARSARVQVVNDADLTAVDLAALDPAAIEASRDRHPSRGGVRRLLPAATRLRLVGHGTT